MYKQSLNINEMRSLLVMLKQFDTNPIKDNLLRMVVMQELGKITIKLETKVIQFAIKPTSTKKVFKLNWTAAQLLALREFCNEQMKTPLFNGEYEQNLLMITSNNINQFTV